MKIYKECQEEFGDDILQLEPSDFLLSHEEVATITKHLGIRFDILLIPTEYKDLYTSAPIFTKILGCITVGSRVRAEILFYKGKK